jgi:hypothetical protein
MHLYNWHHSNVTGILYIHEHRLQYTWCIPLAFYLPLLIPLAPLSNPSLLTWNPLCCDRIRPPCIQVARKLTSHFPPLAHIPSHSKIPTPPVFPRSKYTFIRTTLRTWLTRSSTLTTGQRLCAKFAEKQSVETEYVTTFYHIYE